MCNSEFTTVQTNEDAPQAWTQGSYDSIKGRLIDEAKDSRLLRYYKLRRWVLRHDL